MRNKLFYGIAIFAMVFATCMTGYAQEEVPGCSPCNKCEPWHIPANGCVALQQGQTAVVNVFDWDATYGYCEQQNSASFTYPGTNNPAIRNCRLTFNLCPNPVPEGCEICEFEEGWVIGIQMEILTPGVYFADDPDVPAFNGATLPPWDNLNAAGTYCYSPNTYQLRFRRINHLNITTACNYTTFLDTNRQTYDTFKVSYYQNATQASAGNEITWLQGGPGAAGERLAKVVRTPTPYDGWELTDADVDYNLCNFWIDVPAMIASGTITSGQHVELRVSLLTSEPLEQLVPDINQRIDYLRPPNATATLPPAVDPDSSRWFTGAADWLLGAPPHLNQGLYWENNCTTVPALCATVGFNYDRDTLSHNDADADDNFLLGNGNCRWEWDQQLCPYCGSECFCTIDLGILCCEAAEGDFCLTFPYVLQQAADEDSDGNPDWATGIALSKLCDPATTITPEVTLTLTDCSGASFTAVINPTAADENLTCILGNPGMTVDSMVATYAGWDAAAAGQAWLQVESNFPIGGYQFNMYSAFGNLFGAGVLPQGCWDCQTPNVAGNPAVFDWAD